MVLIREYDIPRVPGAGQIITITISGRNKYIYIYCNQFWSVLLKPIVMNSYDIFISK